MRMTFGLVKNVALLPRAGHVHARSLPEHESPADLQSPAPFAPPKICHWLQVLAPIVMALQMITSVAPFGAVDSHVFMVGIEQALPTVPVSIVGQSQLAFGAAPPQMSPPEQATTGPTTGQPNSSAEQVTVPAPEHAWPLMAVPQTVSAQKCAASIAGTASIAVLASIAGRASKV